jgi:hypothetical protein
MGPDLRVFVGRQGAVGADAAVALSIEELVQVTVIEWTRAPPRPLRIATTTRRERDFGRHDARMLAPNGATVPSMDVNRNSGAETAVYLPFGTFRASSFLTTSSPAVFGLTLASTSRMRPSGPM